MYPLKNRYFCIITLEPWSQRELVFESPAKLGTISFKVQANFNHSSSMKSGERLSSNSFGIAYPDLILAVVDTDVFSFTFNATGWDRISAELCDRDFPWTRFSKILRPSRVIPNELNPQKVRMIMQRNGVGVQEEDGNWISMYQLDESAIIDSLKTLQGHITWSVISIMRGEVIISTVTRCKYTRIYSG